MSVYLVATTKHGNQLHAIDLQERLWQGSNGEWTLHMRTLCGRKAADPTDPLQKWEEAVCKEGSDGTCDKCAWSMETPAGRS